MLLNPYDSIIMAIPDAESESWFGSNPAESVFLWLCVSLGMFVLYHCISEVCNF